MRSANKFYASLHRNKTIMGVEATAFMVVAFAASAMFANRMYILMPFVPFLHIYFRMLTKADYQFFKLFLKYMNESDAYGAISRPSDWNKRPEGWGKGVPW